jgi:hypothetical protein
MEFSCTKCSAPIPLPGQSDLRGGRDGTPREFVSRTNLEILKRVKSPRIQKEIFVPFNEVYESRDAVENSKNWNPSHFRPFIAHNPEDVMSGRQLTEPKAEENHDN